MHQMALGHINSSLNIKEGNDVVIYTNNYAFKGKYKKVLSSNYGVCIEAEIKDDTEIVKMDLIVSCDHISAIGKIQSEIPTIPDSKIAKDLKKYERQIRNTEKAGSAKPQAPK